MYEHIEELPVTGEIHRNREDEAATVDDLSNLVMPVVNHPEVAEIGFSVTHLTMDSDPEIYEIRRIWVRTIHDMSRDPSELGMWDGEHPTLGRVLFGEATTALGRNINSLWNALRDSRYRKAVLKVLGGGDFRISGEGITIGDGDDFDPIYKDWR